MRRLLLLVPMMLTACTGNVMSPQASLDGPLGRFGHTLTSRPASAPPTVAALEAAPTPKPTPTATPAPAAPVVPAPTAVPAPPTPLPPVVTPRPTPSPTPTSGLSDVTVRTRTLQFLIYDYSAEDGDRVQVRLNGAIVRGGEDVTITNFGTYFEVDLQPGPNTLTFQALNVGTAPAPYNSFALYVFSEQVVLGSDRQISRALVTGEIETLLVTAP